VPQAKRNIGALEIMEIVERRNLYFAVKCFVCCVKCFEGYESVHNDTHRGEISKSQSEQKSVQFII
jgi:hypothetical protein